MPDSEELSILLITNNYPNKRAPQVGTFVAALAEEWARQGADVTVIAPRALTSWSALRDPTHDAPQAGRPNVLRPGYLSFSAKRISKTYSTRQLTQWSFEQAAEKAAVALATKNKAKFDVIYGHFLYPGGAAAARIGRRLSLPAAVALGESSIDHWDEDFGHDRANRAIHSMNGILSVSVENADAVARRYGVERGDILVIPNAVDTERFQPTDRSQARLRLGLPEDQRIAAFVGHFIDRKGPLRVQAALEKVPEVFGVFLGTGPERPTGPQVLHADRVPHADVPLWLSAADLFVFPTLAEGSPNAVIEAMACGLPIVSSTIPSLRETVPESAGRLVDPMDIDALAAAIREISQDDDLRERLSRNALETARRSTLPQRAKRIHSWLRKNVMRSS